MPFDASQLHLKVRLLQLCHIWQKKKPNRFWHKTQPDPIWIFLLVQIQVTSANSNKTAEKPEHFLCNIAPKTMSVSPQKTLDVPMKEESWRGRARGWDYVVPAVGKDSASCSLKEGM